MHSFERVGGLTDDDTNKKFTTNTFLVEFSQVYWPTGTLARSYEKAKLNANYE